MPAFAMLTTTILHPQGVRSITDDGAPALGWVSAAGMGGLGKTTMASAVARDLQIRKHFARLAFVSVGQTPSIMALQLVLYEQLTGIALPYSSESSILEQKSALQRATEGGWVGLTQCAPCAVPR